MNIYESSKVLKFIDPEGPFSPALSKILPRFIPQRHQQKHHEFHRGFMVLSAMGPNFFGGNLLKVFDRINYQ